MSKQGERQAKAGPGPPTQALVPREAAGGPPGVGHTAPRLPSQGLASLSPLLFPH